MFYTILFMELFINRKSVPDAINNVKTAGHQATDWRILIRSTGNLYSVDCIYVNIFWYDFFIDMWFQTFKQYIL